ncbi:MAG: 16S rRNA (uracil(1498)-N(3))-methyltransferase [Syntrophomonadaceae bacterium]|jgi:16S rRNA (uracil1498-N3)-methyltransferase
MHRFFINPAAINGNTVIIDQGEGWHIEKVLRLKAGDMVFLFDGTGREYQVELAGKEGVTLKGKIISTRFQDNEPTLQIYLAQGLVKGEKMDKIIQKAVEIGVKAIYPVSCERSVVRLIDEKAEKKVCRWQSIAQEACKQSRRNIVPEVLAISELPAIFKMIGKRPAIMLYENEDKTSLRSLLQEKQYSQADELFIIVGPEGGFSANEARRAAELGIKTASLGPRILRTETAGLVAASIILYEYGELG